MKMNILSNYNINNLKHAKLWLVPLLTIFTALLFWAPLTANASAKLPSIGSVVFPESGTARVWGSGYPPYGEVRIWVYRNHQRVASADTNATSDGSLVWSGAMAGYSTCHDEFDVQAYNVWADQLTANPFASLGCAQNPSLSVRASYTGGSSPALIRVTGSQFSTRAKVGLYVYRNHKFVNYFETTATSGGIVSASENIPGTTFCSAELDVVAYDYVTHQFSNDPNAGVWCIQ
jgi:hypothetical protein